MAAIPTDVTGGGALEQSGQPSNATPRLGWAFGNGVAVIAMILFWIMVAVAIHLYPTEFDWRYMPLTGLLKPRDDPAGHAWAAAGVSLTGVGTYVWALGLTRGWSRFPLQKRPSGLWFCTAGGAMMAIAGAVPVDVPGLPGIHQTLCTLAYAGLTIGVAAMVFQVTTTVLARDGQRRFRHLTYAAFAWGVIALPIVVALMAQAYVFRVYRRIHWVGLIWRDEGVPLILSFSLWEWLTLALVSGTIIALAVAGALVGRELQESVQKSV